MTTDAVIGLAGSGGIGGVVIAIIKYRMYLRKKAAAAAPQKDNLNTLLLSEVVTSLQEMRNILHMGFKQRVNESHQEIMILKSLAWTKQQDELYNGMKIIISNNGLSDKPARLSDIRDLIETVIRATDNTLNSFNINGYLAPTSEKIKFVNSGPAPEVLYKIIMDEKNKNCHKLEDSIRLYGQKILNSIKSEFYDSDSKVKVRNAK